MNSIAYMTIDLCYPKGCLFYTTDKDFDPNVKFVGTWEKIEEGRFIEATVREAKLGTTREAGLPNITGGVGLEPNIVVNTESESNVVFSDGTNFVQTEKSTHTTCTKSDVSTPSWYHDSGINFNASRCSSIYGNASTVQPKSYLCYIWHRTN